MHESISRKFRIEQLESRCMLAADVYISEFMAINDGVLLDENGDDSDWLEIYNAGPDDADLSDYFLTDSRNNLSKWQLPEQNLATGNHLLVFASGKDRRTSGLQLHTNFRLSGDGEFLALTRPNLAGGFEIVSDFSPEYPQQLAGVQINKPEIELGRMLSIVINDELSVDFDGRPVIAQNSETPSSRPWDRDIASGANRKVVVVRVGIVWKRFVVVIEIFAAATTLDIAKVDRGRDRDRATSLPYPIQDGNRFGEVLDRAFCLRILH